jgi:thiamine-phosphate pyrophosphorylase
MKLAVLTPETNVAHETAIVNELFGNGLNLLHLRKPAYSEADYRSYIEQIAPSHQNKIVIHGCYELFKEYELAGIHLNSFSRNDASVWDRINDIPPSFVSTSFHSWDEILQNEFGYGSVFISPLFDSISKPGYKGTIDIAAIKETRATLALQQKHCPQIFGLGGVDKEGTVILQKTGYDGAALLGAIWHTSDPVVAFSHIRAVVTPGV